MLHCDVRVRWKVASDLRFRVAISEAKTSSFCGISGGLAPSTRKSLAIAIVRFWCAKLQIYQEFSFAAERMKTLENQRNNWYPKDKKYFFSRFFGPFFPLFPFFPSLPFFPLFPSLPFFLSLPSHCRKEIPCKKSTKESKQSRKGRTGYTLN